MLTNWLGSNSKGSVEIAMATGAENVRRRWMSTLATAPWERLSALWNDVPEKPEFSFLRPPECGLVMTQGRAGGVGAAFNMGEMTVTRCSVRLADGTVGHAYLAGRNKKKAEVAAVMDALLQDSSRHDALHTAVIRPLQAERTAQDDERARKVAATKVDFFTLVRGED